MAIRDIHEFRKAKLALIAKYGPSIMEGGGDRAAELQKDAEPLAEYAYTTTTKVLSFIAQDMRIAAGEDTPLAPRLATKT